MLVAQILCTNAFYKQVQTERGNDNNYLNNEQTLAMLEKILNALQKEINNLKSEI